jgi:tetratricopeptide (TPR) repeat protein
LDEALALQPNGVAAITGSAYLLLDKQKALASISTFKRALGISPEYAPALFGLAEAYRAQGETSQAAENYRKYLGVAPGGPDAPAARRQLKDLESAAPKKAPPAAEDGEAAPAKESAKAEPAAAASAVDQPGAP